MNRWPSSRVASVLGAAPTGDRDFTSVSTDTRAIQPGALFVALVGERFDGHDFIGDAVARGATGVVSRFGTEISGDVSVFQVADTLTALGDLGNARRHDISGPVIAVTGTNGKTATKELLSKALGTRWSVHATSGNLNNLIGVPLTLLSAPDDAGALVVEAGASIPGEIARLREIIDPTIGVVTNVSTGHLEGFGSEEGVLAEKVSLLDGVTTAVVGTLPAELAERARDVAARVIVAGVDESADVHPDGWILDGDGKPVVEVDGVTVTLPLVGRHQADNAMLAFAVARELGLNPARVSAALETVTLPSGRCEVLRDGDLVVLHDAYNANPVSIAASLETAQAMRGLRPLVVVLGTMLELGERGAELHQSVANTVVDAQPNLVAVTGEFVSAFDAHAAALGERLLTADDPPTLGERLAERLEGGEFVLLKASRGVRLERVIPHIIKTGDD